ncbi:tRNA (N(6)-L-threonylcarbamoyladenosine(37)-C(2))-methylthiotransferase MtaB [Candidatus Falkowbacteria bacterium HGW-Falkowbacteria-2]|uniref:tRNA (N(6)-L-threonylcarbamoyladenosine(37)-C(2))-methylthiotransferase MtaB n=1 Tax=Candidatus Falkowbacteria bacterium HGW-Falkowbacteria-2 TaxID=2013769 RepID=A0A2N2E1I9_9BACT|nr:MAG: tRNA (N(6)-L-threonylcarbamoyladenosine(37)-C(2))-methylthiotransferase MtaB [Candidatus Falkowbacteria bacterium HGW-Falkowbacteria-2]
MSKNQPTFQIRALGCKVSQYDAAELRRELESQGFNMGNDNPSVVIINTCAVTKAAMKKDRQLARKLRAAHPEALLVVMGCWPQTNEKLAKAELADDSILFWGVGRIRELAELICEKVGKPVVAVKFESGLVVSSERSRYILKVGDGCNQFCSYCLIPFARGRLKSRERSIVLAEAKAAIEAGYDEIVLSGIHLGLYGTDLAGKYFLKDLLIELLQLSATTRFRLSSIEVTEVDDDLISLITQSDGRICRHLHISLQSGSDKILSAMKRPYNTEFFLDRLKAIRAAMPEIGVTTDVIVGFPGETDDDFNDTLSFLKKCNFAGIHVFPFSPHEQTAAFTLEGRVAPRQIKERALALRRVSEEAAQVYREGLLKRFAGQKMKLVSEKKGGEFIKGHSEFYPIFSFPKKLAPGLEAGKMIEVEVRHLS